MKYLYRKVLKHNKYSFFILFLLISLLFSIENSSALMQLSKEEEAIVIKFMNKDLRAKIGQIIMVGLPKTKDCSKDDDVIKIIGDNGIGNILIKKQNLTSETINNSHQLNMNTSRCFIDELQKIATDISKGKSSLIIAAYHDSFMYSSIPYDKSFMSMPGLSLATTGNKDLIQLAGKLQGSQLQLIGINMLLGPCINTAPESSTNVTNNYSHSTFFGGHSKIVYEYASKYIDGLKEANLIVIGKYFPRKVDHNGRTYYGSINNCFASRKINTKLHGVMTSYLKMKLLPSIYSPAAFSKSFIDDIIRSSGPVKNSYPLFSGLDFKDHHIVVSEDLSNFQIIKQFKIDSNSKSCTFSTIAKEAFEEGNDILFFKNIASSNEKSLTTTLTVEKIENIIESLYHYIHNNSEREERLNQSLERILRLKARSIKSLCDGKFEGFNNTCNPYHNHKEIGLENIKELTGNKDYESSEKFIEEIIKQSMITVNMNERRPYKINKTKDNNIVFYIEENAVQFFQDCMSGNPTFITIPVQKEKNWKEIVQNDFYRHIESQNCNCIVYTVLDKIDADLLNKAFKIYRNDLSSKLIIFLHNSPIILSKHILSSATIVGCFTRHSIAYQYDVMILKNGFSPQHILKLPVNVCNSNIENKIIDNLTKELSSSIPFEEYTKVIQNRNDLIDKYKKRISSYNEEFQIRKEQLIEKHNDDLKDMSIDLDYWKSNADKYTSEVNALKKEVQEYKEMNDLFIVISFFLLMIILIYLFTLIIPNKQTE